MSEERSAPVQLAIELAMPPEPAREAVLAALAAALEVRGIEPAAGADRLDVRVEPRGDGARVIIAPVSPPFPDDPGERAAWLASEVLAPMAGALSEAALGEWITDRHARRPWGAAARATYRDPLYHHPNFSVILAELALKPQDRFLDVACGGGALLKRALESGCTAAGIDHSPDMVRTARELNADAIAAGRLDVRRGTATDLPFPDGAFTAASMTGVLGFLDDPVGALAELRRVLAPDGRAVALGSDPEARGTPAAPEPFASHLRFYDDEALARLGRDAGFDHVRVIRRSMEAYAREAGVPEEHVPLFAGDGARFLLLCRGED